MPRLSKKQQRLRKTFVEGLRDFERTVGVPEDFTRRLMNHPDDWAFVIQTHALMEGALSEALTTALRDQRLIPIMGRLAVGDSRTGKLAFAQALGILSNDRVAFVRGVSQLRNRLLHRFREHIEFSLSSYIAGLSDTAREELLRGCVGRSVQQSTLEMHRASFVDDPRFIFLLGLMRFIHDTLVPEEARYNPEQSATPLDRSC